MIFYGYTTLLYIHVQNARKVNSNRGKNIYSICVKRKKKTKKSKIPRNTITIGLPLQKDQCRINHCSEEIQCTFTIIYKRKRFRI